LCCFNRTKLEQTEALNIVQIHCIFVQINPQMKRFNSFYSLNVFSLQLKNWEYPEHSHNFYELIFIEEGNGSQTLNGITFSYKKDDVFILTPADIHFFTIENETTFLFIKFTEQIFIDKLAGNKDNNWYKAIRTTLQNPNLQPGNIIKDPDERQNIVYLAKMLKLEFVKKQHYHNEVVLELFGIIMVLVARNITNALSNNGTTSEDKTIAILSYIRQNAFYKEKMRIREIADVFNMSPNYVSIYIKKHTGISVQKLIIQTKLKAAEQLLEQGKMNINEISGILGFTDASHFNKLFKKYKMMNPSAKKA
jgi:YesN/AraC family two-component response regulator